MKIAIIGAGIAGVTTAFELTTQGHQVSVFERCGSVAAEASFANAGIVAPALALPWTAAPWPRLSRSCSLRWQWQRRRAAQDKNAGPAQEQLLQLAQFSLERLQTLRRSLQLDYERASGQLLLLRTERELAQIQPGLSRLAQHGITPTLLDAAACRAIEPGLNPEQALHGGIHLPQAELGNCRQFAHLLRLEAQRLGAQFRFHTTVRSITPGTPTQLLHEYTPPAEHPGPSTRYGDAGGGDTRPAPHGPQRENFDAIVVCAGTGAPELLQPLGFKLALAQLPGYSVTAALRQLEAHPDLGPRAGLIDQATGISISRIGQRVRLCSSGEQGGKPRTSSQIAPAALQRLHKVLNDWFPGAMQSGQQQQWTGRQAQLADGLPLLGQSGHAGIWLNLAHEPSALLGWTLACGAASVISSQLSGQQAGADIPEISDLGVGRLA